MALNATHIHQVLTTGNDANGGGFDTNATFLTNGAATSATGASPVFSSASYSFVAGDVGAFVFIKSGTNWQAGWYEIASVAAGAATLKAAVGEASLVGSTTLKSGPNVTAGCATVASPTAATFGIDYSQQAAAEVAYTDLVIGTTTTQLTSAANPIGVNLIGNILNVTGGTGFTTGWYRVQSVSGITATMDRSVGTAASTGGTGNLGGALLTIAQALTLSTIDGMMSYVKGTYGGLTSALSPPSRAGQYRTRLVGYSTVRGDEGRAVLQWTAAVNGLTPAGGWTFENLELDGTSTGLKGFAPSAAYGLLWNCHVHHWTGLGIDWGANSYWSALYCEINNNVGGISGASSQCTVEHCRIISNTGTGVKTTTQAWKIISNLIANNSGASSDGIEVGYATLAKHNICYGNGRDGIRAFNSYSFTIGSGFIANNILVNNGGYGINQPTAQTHPYFPWIDFNASYNNTSGPLNNVNLNEHDVTLTGDPFTNAAGNDFTLNNTAGAGAACRNAGTPGTLPGLPSQVGYADIGVYRHQDAAGGGGLARIIGG